VGEQDEVDEGEGAAGVLPLSLVVAARILVACVALRDRRRVVPDFGLVFR
ncbi:hypothetical protein B296_00041670, partial [Ensete ventricosum]